MQTSCNKEAIPLSNAKTAGMSRKTVGKIALLMAGILAFSAVITLFTGVSHKKEADKTCGLVFS